MADPEFEDHAITNAVVYSKEGVAIGVIEDIVAGIKRLAVDGTVQITPPMAPPATTPITIAADTPLVVSGSNDTFHVITNGKVFTIQQLEAGAAGDPQEKGSVVELFWAPNGDASVLEIIARDYLLGFTTVVTPNTSTSRVGTSLLGDGTAAILVRRRRIAGASQEIDAVIRGFES